jgi:O-antigen/teichoic acid export membrane protein
MIFLARIGTAISVLLTILSLLAAHLYGLHAGAVATCFVSALAAGLWWYSLRTKIQMVEMRKTEREINEEFLKLVEKQRDS